MARTTETITTITDDLTGKPIDSDEVNTVSIVVNGQGVSLDLSDESLTKLENALAKFAKDTERVPMRVSTTTTTSKSKYPEGYLQAVRAWAKDNGIQVPSVGIVRKDVIAQYEEATK